MRPIDNSFHPDYNKTWGCLNVHNFKSKKMEKIGINELSHMLKLDVSMIFEMIDNNEIPHEWLSLYNETMLVCYRKEIEELLARGSTREVSINIMENRYMNANQ